MLIPAFFLSCTVAIGDLTAISVPGATPRIEWQTTGTGFFYGFMTKDDPEPGKKEYEIHLVTPRHVVQDRPALKVRLNPSAAGVAGEQFEILRDPPNGQSTWFYHQDPTIDVAAVRVDYNFVQKKGLEVSFFAQGQHTILRDQMN